MSISVFVVWTAVLLGGFLLTVATYVRADRKRQQAADRELITLRDTIQQRDQALQRAELNSLRMVRYQIITARLAEALTIPEIVDIVINQGLGLWGAVSGAISLLDKETNALEIASDLTLNKRAKGMDLKGGGKPSKVKVPNKNHEGFNQQSCPYPPCIVACMSTRCNG